MSNNVLNAVWKQSRARGASRLLLVAMADSANDEGMAWGKIATWADKVYTNERSVQYQVSKLVALGELVVTGEYGRSKSLHFWIPLLPDEEGYDPQPCSENHRCNRKHTSLAETMAYRERSRRSKRVQNNSPIPTEKDAETFTHSPSRRRKTKKGAKNDTERVQDFAERVQDFAERVQNFTNGSGENPDGAGADANANPYGTLNITPKREPAHTRDPLSQAKKFEAPDPDPEADPPQLRGAPPTLYGVPVGEPNHRDFQLWLARLEIPNGEKYQPQRRHQLMAEYFALAEGAEVTA